jgi:hypothetical protein
MDKRYQGVIRRGKSMKDRKSNGQKIPRRNKKMVHCFVSPSLIYAFFLPLGIFCPLFCLSFIDLRLLITPWYLLSIVLSVLHWFTPSYYPSVSFVHYFVCPSLIYAFLLHLGIFCPLFFLSFIDLRLLITPWYLLSIALSVRHWFTPSNEGQKKQWTKDTKG